MAGGFQAAILTLGLWKRAPGYLVIAPGGGLRTWMPGSLIFAMIYRNGRVPTHRPPGQPQCAQPSHIKAAGRTCGMSRPGGT